MPEEIVRRKRRSAPALLIPKVAAHKVAAQFQHLVTTVEVEVERPAVQPTAEADRVLGKTSKRGGFASA